MNDPIVESIHLAREEIIKAAGDDSHQITLLVQKLAMAAKQRIDVQWQTRAAPATSQLVGNLG
jgi:hypothetical protein